MHFRGGREAVDERAYPDIRDFYADVARVYREEIKIWPTPAAAISRSTR